MVGSGMGEQYIRWTAAGWPEAMWVRYDPTMRTWFVLLVAVAAFVAIETPSGHGSTPPAENGQTTRPTVEEIMGHAMTRAESQDEAGSELEFESFITTTVETLNGDGVVTKTDTSRHHRYPVAGALFEELVERNGEPLDQNDLRDERERHNEFRRDAQEAAKDGEKLETNDERQVRFDQELMSRYRAEVIGEETVRGERCWVIAFEPRDGKLPERTRIDKALNRSTGRLYVSQEDHGVIRIEFALQRPIRYVWGLIATLRTATGHLDFERVAPNVWLPDAFDFRIEVRVFFRTRRQRVVREWVERKRFEPNANQDVSSG